MLRRLFADLLARRWRADSSRWTDAEVEQQRRAVIARHGEWTAHNLKLRPGLYTMGPAAGPAVGPAPGGDEPKLRRVVQAVADASGKPLAALRVMDLACLEGLYALEFARHGSDVVAIEGREANIAKARFAQAALGLANVEFLRDDVRNFSRERHGAFDVVLCLGILYHLDTPDVFELLERVAQACTRLAVVDTHISLEAQVTREYRGSTYRGRVHVEHPGGATAEEKQKVLWASLDNAHSFFLTRESLLDALSAAGFSSVYECVVPFEAGKPADRVTLLAIKGAPVTLESAPGA